MERIRDLSLRLITPSQGHRIMTPTISETRALHVFFLSESAKRLSDDKLNRQLQNF